MFTPKLLEKVAGRSIKRPAVDSPVAKMGFLMSPNPETYFLADNRIKFKKRAKVDEAVMNDASKGKGPTRRKKRMRPTLTANDRLPEALPSTFSVTAEATKASANIKPEEFIYGSTHDNEVDRLLRDIVDNQFPDWLGLFRQGFNVMMYGYGSKLNVFREFEEYVGEEHLVVRVNGLFPKLNARKFLRDFLENVMPGERVRHSTNLEVLAKNVVAALSEEDLPDVFILVNNFDTMVLRQPPMLQALCWLVQVPYIHILASADTVNAFLGVSQSQALRLKFCWMHCPTFKQYREELKWTPGIYGDETRAVTQKSSLKYVLQSLTGNARKAFAILAQMQLKQMKAHQTKRNAKDQVYSGVRFQALARECREKFIAHTDDNLRTLLVEFFDHKLIRQSGRGRNVENLLLIELDMDTLEEVIPELEQS